MVGIEDVARRAGVSTATVSRALSGRGPVAAPTRVRVEAAAKALGYVVSASASGLASGRTRSIGVLVPLLDRWYFSTVLAGIADALMRDGYDVTLYNLTSDRAERERLFEMFLRRQRVDAVIAIALDLTDPEVDRLAELPIPVIVVGGPDPGLPTLDLDEEAVAYAATAHLLALGHRDIALLGAGPWASDEPPVITRRRRGFAAALARAGLTLRADRCVAAEFSIADGHRATSALLSAGAHGPTAIFAVADEIAIGAILAAREHGVRVPEDLSIAGIDGHDLGELFRLTTVDQFPRAQGERAAAAVLSALSGDAAGMPASVSLPWELVVRGSSAPPRPDRGVDGTGRSARVDGTERG